jgi:hypothetical protein
MLAQFFGQQFPTKQLGERIQINTQILWLMMLPINPPAEQIQPENC